jgi:cyclase
MASSEKRKTLTKLVKKIAETIFIPFTVGGGINSVKDIQNILKAGADKVSINTAAIKNPKLVKRSAKIFGSQCIVVAIDAKKIKDYWEVFIEGGKKSTGINAIEWARKVEELGCGEILLTSIDKDGTKGGYDLELTKKMSGSINIPVIASGGAGSLKDISEVFKKGKADAALIASILHYKKYRINEIKGYLKKQKIKVRK